jgi:tetratricopeptide (TPR) repeat protein
MISQELTVLLQDVKMGNRERKIEAIRKISKAGKGHLQEIRPVLIDIMEKGDNLIAYIVSCTLAELGDQSNETVENLIINLNPPPGENENIIKFATTQALSHIRNNKHVIDALMNAYQTDTNISVRLGSIWALGAIGDISSKDFLEYIATHEEGEELRAAQAALELFGKGSFEEIQNTKVELGKNKKEGPSEKGFFNKLFGSKETHNAPKQSPQPLRCLSCGNKVTENTKFCGSCGAAITPTTSSNSVPLAASSISLQSRSTVQDIEDANYWFEKGCNIVAIDGSLDEALTCFENAIKFNPVDDGAWYMKGVALSGLERYNESLTCLDTAIKINFNDDEYWFHKGLALNGLERYNEALTCFDTAIKIDPNNYMAWLEKGDTLRQLSRFNEARISFDNAIKILPNAGDGAAWFGKGQALIGLKQLKEAKTCFYKAIEINPDYEDKLKNSLGNEWSTRLNL